MATIKDVAKLAKVSLSTASYSLNDNPIITKATRDKVKKAALELKYVPNARAQGLRRKKGDTLGIYVSGFEGPVHSMILSGIQDIFETKKSKFHMLVTFIDDEMSLITKNVVDVALIMDSRVSEEEVASYSNIMPIILFDNNSKGENIYNTFIDNQAGIKDRTNWFINEGCKKVGFLKGSKDSYHNQLRFLGYKEALVESNIDFDESLVFDANAFTEQRGYEVMKELLKKGPLEIDALVCGNDELALGAMQAFQEYNIKVPEDVKISGFDNIERGKFSVPSLSTVSIDWREYGKKLALLALDILESKNPAKTLWIPSKLINRESS